MKEVIIEATHSVTGEQIRCRKLFCSRCDYGVFALIYAPGEVDLSFQCYGCKARYGLKAANAAKKGGST